MDGDKRSQIWCGGESPSPAVTFG